MNMKRTLPFVRSMSNKLANELRVIGIGPMCRASIAPRVGLLVPPRHCEAGVLLHAT